MGTSSCSLPILFTGITGARRACGWFCKPIPAVETKYKASILPRTQAGFTTPFKEPGGMGAAHTLHPGCEVPAAQAGEQGAALSGAGGSGHSPWPRIPGLSLPTSRPTASLAARGTPTPPAQGTAPPSPHPGAAGKSRPHPGRRHRKEHMQRPSAARPAVHQRPVAAARLQTEQL